MKFWLIIKITAGVIVMSIVMFSMMLTYHVTQAPLGGVFEKLIPESENLLHSSIDQNFAKALEAEEMPDFEPGDKAFQKAHELLALGRHSEAREKLKTIISLFSSSPSAPAARKILSTMNLDELLARTSDAGKEIYQVKPGDSYYAIAARKKTTLDMIIYLNDMFRLKPLQPGDQLKVMPLDYRVIIDLQQQSIALWDDANFVADYPIVTMNGNAPKKSRTTIKSRRSTINQSSISSISEDYRQATRSILLNQSSMPILSYDNETDELPFGIFLAPEDIEELFLLTRAGNTVEIR